MKPFEIVVPYFLSGKPRQLSMRVLASSLAEALAAARCRARSVRPLLGGQRVIFGGSAREAPLRAA